MSFVSRSLTKIKNLWQLPREQGVPNPIPKEGATLVVTHAELTARHGTGALLLKILRGEPNLAVFYARNFFKTHDIEVPAFHVSHDGSSPNGGVEFVRQLLTGKRLRRIFCVPFYEDDVLTALAAKQLTGAPLVLYVMDDQNIHVQEISDGNFGSLVSQADLCLAISPLLCTAYQQKYGRRFWLAPPVADPDLFVPPEYNFVPNLPPRGILVGNLWSSHTLGRFRETIRVSGLQIDWYGNAGKPFIELDPDELSKEGIALHSHIPERALADIARSADFAVLPAGTLDGTDTHEWLARASIPSRIIFLIAAANVPIVVLGHPETAAARFVTDLGIGGVCDYSPESFAAAVRQVTEPDALAQIRDRARKLSPLFSSTEFSEWLWKSLTQRNAIDSRFENLMGKFEPLDTNALPVHFVAKSSQRHPSDADHTSMITKIKEGISSTGQRALGIDDVRYRLGAVMEKLDSDLAKLDTKLDTELAKLDSRLSKLDRLAPIEGNVDRLNQQVQNLRSFLAWSTHRVEPWFWTGNFSQTDPEEELAALLFNFLPSHILVDAGPTAGRFAQVAADIGYQVFRLEPPNTIGSLVGSGALPGPIDFLNLAKDLFDPQLVNALDSIQPPVIQAEFLTQQATSSQDKGGLPAPRPSTEIAEIAEIMKELRSRQYYWTVIIFRTEAEDFIRLATNLVILPDQAWGKILFFRDYQLFLKAFHWCKTALPRFRAAPLSR